MANLSEAYVENEVYLEPELERDLQIRLSRIEGHIRGVKEMLSEHKDCESLLTQLAAIRGAINQVTVKLLEEHIEMCVASGTERGNGTIALNKLKGALAIVLKNS
jgi:DNA-binding FrmR family transcriptional regulator